MATREKMFASFLAIIDAPVLLNGWDEEKLALGLPLFLKKHASVWFKTLSGSENLTF